MRALIVTRHDYANVGWRIYSALREFSGVDVRYWSSDPRGGYQYDIAGPAQRAEADAIAGRADVVHYIDGGHPALGGGLETDKPAVLSLNESKWYDTTSTRMVREKWLAPVVGRAKITSLTPFMDLGIVAHEYVPQPLDVRAFVPVEHESRSPLVVGHFPSGGRFALKGTPEIRRELEGWPGVSLRVVTNQPQADALALKRGCDVVVDQLKLGTYGYNTLEAAAFGIPVLCYVKKVRAPIIGVRPDGKGLREATHMLRDPVQRKRYGDALRTWVEAEHSYPAVAKRWERIYGEVVA
ncbi:MAG: hypothetical protein VW239_00210 [Candidatus Nanopelagicales bacterium]